MNKRLLRGFEVRALITGITGQDGGYLAERLLQDGYQVHGLVHNGDSSVNVLRTRSPSIILHQGDLRDADSLSVAITEANPDEVYNLASTSSVAFSWEKPVTTADVTALGTARLLHEIRLHQDKTGCPVRFIQASSAEIFGNAVGIQDENTPLNPVSPYGAAKAFAHQLVGIYRQTGLFAISLIFFNHESPRRPVTFVTRKITKGVANIVNGQETELVLGNLDARRDWGWAPDYVDAMVRAARATAPEDFVIATGETHSIREFALAAFSRAGIENGESRIRIDDSIKRPNDPSTFVGDASKAKRLLGWKPLVGFKEIVDRMVDNDLDCWRPLKS